MPFRRLRAPAAVVSVVMALAFCWGYVGEGNVWAHRWRPWRTVPDYRSAGIEVRQGRVEFRTYSTISTDWVGLNPELLPSGTHLHGHFDYHSRIDVRDALYRLEAHRVIRTATEREYVVAAPIWCVLVPLGIAPSLWVRDRRRHRLTRLEGFTVNGPVPRPITA